MAVPYEYAHGGEERDAVESSAQRARRDVMRVRDGRQVAALARASEPPLGDEARDAVSAQALLGQGDRLVHLHRHPDPASGTGQQGLT